MHINDKIGVLRADKQALLEENAGLFAAIKKYTADLEVIKTNHDNLRTQHDALLKQARKMAKLLKAVAGGDDCQTEASELLAKYADEIKF